LGVNFLYSKQLDWILVLPAVAIGFLSVGVLNLNNMRDVESDKLSNKNTVVVKIGIEAAKKYHYVLVIGAMILVLIFAIFIDFNKDVEPEKFNFDTYFFVVAYFPLISHLITVYKTTNSKLLDPELKKLAISTFLLSILLSLSLIYLLSDLVVNS
jgi:1,4-dihydroxy-2-naphthoate octaprenyltransferase